MFDTIRDMQLYTASRMLHSDILLEDTTQKIETDDKPSKTIEDILQKYKKPYRESENKKQKKEALESFRRDLTPFLVEEYKWPTLVAKTVSKFAYPANGPTKGKSITDYLLAFELGGLPERYVEPLAKIMKVERPFITGNHLKFDWGSTVLTALLAYTVPDLGENISSSLTQIAPIVGETLKYTGYSSGIIMGINTAIKTVQLPYRTWKHVKHDEHTAAPAGIFDVILPNAILNGTLFYHDWKEKLKENLKEFRTPTNNTTPAGLEYPPKEIVQFYKDS
ncbi:hypothetical protein COV13_01500 [Candidatus Woesearchaeota archaeon CG10_big_fil_rev_8_21_14_0_10_32_9]|nr:MAG: hypothetical protein COV13_01500 [Candidatus Woesearchaeota archaeon CG10_big_fil_rev_8_21_14_0_10_32_9]